VSEVFAYMDEPANQAEITPSMVAAERIERLDNGGNHARYTYSMAGVTLEGEVRATEYVPDERIVYAIEGEIDGEIRWTFEPEDGGTRVTYAAAYEVPAPALENVVESFVRLYNRREVETALANLQARFEATDARDGRGGTPEAVDGSD
jgi:uncharacterized membrane protein